MSSIFDRKAVRPMLLTEAKEPITANDWFCELKLDGIRCIAYLDSRGTDLRNKRNMLLLPVFPELNSIHSAVDGQCILDGELVILDKDGKPDFESLQSRSLMTGPKVKLSSAQKPACFVAFDVLYHNGVELTQTPLEERKKLLRKIVADNSLIAVSRVFDNALALFSLTQKLDLEGIVQKRKDTFYYFGKRSKDWVKVKHLIDEDFIACGYIIKSAQVTSLVLASYTNGRLSYEGHVTLGVSREIAASYPTTSFCPFDFVPSGNESAIWYNPLRICTVTYMERTSAGGMRQPRFKTFRESFTL